MIMMMIRIRIKGQCTDLFHLIKIIDTMVGKSMQQSIGFVRPEEFLHSALPFFLAGLEETAIMMMLRTAMMACW